MNKPKTKNRAKTRMKVEMSTISRSKKKTWSKKKTRSKTQLVRSNLMSMKKSYQPTSLKLRS